MIVKHKLDALTALRFFAAAMIVLTHAHNIFGSFGIANAAPLGQGVSFFFVLSGFILAYNYPDLSQKGAVARFFVARFARIWPLHLVTCVIWIGLIFHFDRAAYFGGFSGLGRLLANLLLVQSWFPFKAMSLSFNGVAWSISNEMYFYMLFPILIGAWNKNWAKIMFCLAGIVVVFIVVGNVMKLQSTDDYYGVSLLGTIYFNPIVRAFEFAFGIGLAKVFMTPALHEIKFTKLGWLFIELASILFIVVAMITAGDPSRIGMYFGPAAAYYFQREGLWLIWGILILTFALSKGPINALLSTKPMVFLGEISFALYLVHAILITFLDEYIETVQLYGGLGYAAFWAVALISAALLFKGVEDPCRKLIMNAWDGKQPSFPKSFKSSYNSVAIACLAGLVAGFLLVYFNRPSTIVTLSDNSIESIFQNPKNLRIAQASFANGISIKGVTFTDLPDGKHVETSLILKSEKEMVLDGVIAMHLNDQTGNILSTPGDLPMDKMKSKIPANTYWKHKFIVTKKELDNCASVGIAMYKSPSNLISVESNSSDWGGKRLIIPAKR